MTSFGYSNRYYYDPSSQKKGSSGKQLETLAGKLNITCIALCEVVTSKELRRSGDIWVCSNSEHVVTRFFFVYDTNSATSEASSLHTETNRAFKQEIMHAVALAKKMKLDNSTASKTK
ncbi:PREDICTED: poly [ADP-ribose] polymerase 6-like [Amphimedon queenslandica]|nr:PREDICTED: poly [ADP-ribose] polymerase 6-like [Amphimedon queenslandica]|eukprot:XP_019849462.1 PREDICTED: poly [ADP-ribose] polymerase 6-like [Amphimedon queenslandica]